MIGCDAVDRAVDQGFDQGLPVCFGPEWWIHLVLRGVEISYRLVGQAEMMWSDFTGDVHPVGLGPADLFDRLDRRQMLDLDRAFEALQAAVDEPVGRERAPRAQPLDDPPDARLVDVADLGILASNWQKTGKLFSDGDFNYNGGIDYDCATKQFVDGGGPYDFAQLGHFVQVSNAMFRSVKASTPVKNVKELVAYARAHPGKLTFGSAGVGTTQHLAGELLQSSAGVQMQHVPFKGTAHAATAAMSATVTTDHAIQAHDGTRPPASGDAGQVRNANRPTQRRRSCMSPPLPAAPRHADLAGGALGDAEIGRAHV